MSYKTQSEMSMDGGIRNRCAQAAAQEGVEGDPDVWTYDHRRQLAAAPGWEAAWDSAKANGNPDPGNDESVITDGMILSQVQAMLAAP
jgi:hypothetical protein